MFKQTSQWVTLSKVWRFYIVWMKMSYCGGLKTQQSFMSWSESSLCVAGSRSWRCCDQAWASRKVRDSGAQQWSCLLMLWATQTIRIYTHTCREGRPIITNLKNPRWRGWMHHTAQNGFSSMNKKVGLHSPSESFFFFGFVLIIVTE